MEYTKSNFNAKGKNPRTERVLAQIKTQKIDLQLPKEVGESLRSLPLKERKAYATLLRKAGWTLKSIGKELNITRESIRLYAKEEHSPEIMEKVAHLTIPEIPKIEVYKERVIKVSVEADVLNQLKELKEKAFWVRGKGSNNRAEAEQYTKLIYETMQSGVSCYRLAKELKVTPSAIFFRLVRYGYNTSTGKSLTYRQIKHRTEIENV